MKPPPRRDYRRTRSSLLVSSGICGTRKTATLVSTYLREQRVGLPGRPPWCIALFRAPIASVRRPLATTTTTIK